MHHEDIATMQDAFEAFRDLTGSVDALTHLANMMTQHLPVPGEIHQELGERAQATASKLTLKGKRLLRSWPQLLQADTVCARMSLLCVLYVV